MKQRTGITLTALLLALFLTADVQAQQPRRGQMAPPDTMSMMMGQGMMMHRMMGMRGGMQGMHQQMMQNPLHRTTMMIYALPALADTLGLSDEQRKQLQQQKEQFLSQRQARRQEMQAQRKELMALFEGTAQPETSAVREQLQALATLRAEHQAARYEAAVQMRNVLTDAQRQTLDEIEPRALHRQLMANMTVMEMMQMMRAMHGGRMGMGGAGMMQGMRPMMQHGPMHRQRMQQNQR